MISRSHFVFAEWESRRVTAHGEIRDRAKTVHGTEMAELAGAGLRVAAPAVVAKTGLALLHGFMPLLRIQHLAQLQTNGD